jgi:truncated hemoglobin YjbI
MSHDSPKLGANGSSDANATDVDADAPEPELFDALGGHEGLRAVLEEFYARVYEDARLAPFFEGVSIDRAVGKQYSFMLQLITGEKVYFGDRPRNAHHWMVISDELFDYREELLADCLRRRGMPERLVARWRALDERFRKQIVKSSPRPKRVRGEDYPLDGWGSVELTWGTLCDGCGGEVNAGAVVRYHQRTGKTRCARCWPSGHLRAAQEDDKP